MVMDVGMVAVDQRQRGGHAPFGIEGVVHRRQPVAVDGAHLVVVLADLADTDLAVAGHRLILVDVLEAQVETHAGLGPDTLRVPAGIDHAEGGAARGVRPARERACAREHCQKQLFHVVLPSKAEKETSYERIRRRSAGLVVMRERVRAASAAQNAPCSIRPPRRRQSERCASRCRPRPAACRCPSRPPDFHSSTSRPCLPGRSSTRRGLPQRRTERRVRAPAACKPPRSQRHGRRRDVRWRRRARARQGRQP